MRTCFSERKDTIATVRAHFGDRNNSVSTVRDKTEIFKSSSSITINQEIKKGKFSNGQITRRRGLLIDSK